ncbi:hypothetical protein [Promicromonospora iranensis]|uniref:Type II secretory pathway pseudopilin PulG n=1 Tax=Promicromonospora iranensis TaxID=1105144 RepID=A0ABU2CGT6_9MICO|nr:hypothetical protein [Promicromonospora iranensis]MDR7380547.1 type II secretory pathway pseudopilin PulG [Promicromonospora iranensis]
MRKVHLIREFAPDAYEFALSSWSWIGTGDKTPRFASCFGDMFLESPDGWWFLDSVEGTLDRCWDSMEEMFADLEGADGRAEYLLEETLNAALGQGLHLDEDEVFAFLPPPAVTGTMSVSSLAPLRFAIAANLAGRIHGELNGVQPDAGASALFAAQRYAAQQAAAQEATARQAAAQQTAAQQAVARQAAARRAAAQEAAARVPAPPVATPQRVAAAPTFDAPNPRTDRWQPAAQQAGYEPQYAAGSELDYAPGQTSAYDTGGYAPAPAVYAAPAAAGAHATGAHAAPVAAGGYDYVDTAHTADSGQFSQYIADQYNTGQIAAVDHGASAPAQPRLQQGGRWSYA